MNNVRLPARNTIHRLTLLHCHYDRRSTSRKIVQYNPLMPLFYSVVSRAAECPTEIKDLACLLDSNSYSTCQRSMLSRLFPGLSFTRGARKFSYRLTRTTHKNSGSEILDILELVLSTVGTLRALSDASRSGARQSTIPFWSLLIRSLTFFCYDKSYAMWV